MIEETLLIIKARNGDEDALGNLIERYYNHIFSYISRRMNYMDITKDLTQEVFLKLVGGLNNYKFTGKFSNYLFTIAVNVCNDYFRRSKNNLEYSEGNTIDTNPIHNPEANFLREENARQVREYLSTLPRIQKEVIILRFYHDMKLKDIANITNVPLSTVKSRLKQGLEKLKVKMNEERHL